MSNERLFKKMATENIKAAYEEEFEYMKKRFDGKSFEEGSFILARIPAYLEKEWLSLALEKKDVGLSVLPSGKMVFQFQR